LDKLLLNFVKWFSPLFARQGVDTKRMFTIVETKLKLDKRRTYIQSNNSWKKKKEEDTKNRFLIVLILYGFFSLLIGGFIAGAPNVVFGMTVFHAYVLFMMVMTLITDFSTVMLDTTDNVIILPRPVSSKTLFMARTVHVFIYLGQLAIAMCLIPIILIFATHGIAAGLGSIITTFSTVLLAVFFTYLLYMLILRYASEQKLKDVISYFQIVMTIFFVVGYQIIPRLIDFSDISNNFSLSPYAYIAPPIWMALTIEAISTGIYDTLHIIMIVLALLVSPLLFWGVTKYLAPSFSRKMAALSIDTVVAGKKDKPVKKGPARFSLPDRIARLFCKRGAEEASFLLTWKITTRDKQFRLQFYPAFAYSLVFIFLFVFNGGKNMEKAWNSMGETNNFLWFIYTPLFAVINGAKLISYHDNYQAAGVYFFTPLSRPGELITGSLKTIFIKYAFPLLLVFFVVAFSIWGVPVIDDFVLGFFISLNCLFIGADMSQKYLPFSQQLNTQQQAGKWLFAILQLMAIGVLILLHYLALRWPLIIYLLIPVTAAGAFILLRKLQRTPWFKISL
jgi:hypothetical protein